MTFYSEMGEEKKGYKVYLNGVLQDKVIHAATSPGFIVLLEQDYRMLRDFPDDPYLSYISSTDPTSHHGFATVTCLGKVEIVVEEEKAGALTDLIRFRKPTDSEVDKEVIGQTTAYGELLKPLHFQMLEPGTYVPFFTIPELMGHYEEPRWWIYRVERSPSSILESGIRITLYQSDIKSMVAVLILDIHRPTVELEYNGFSDRSLIRVKNLHCKNIDITLIPEPDCEISDLDFTRKLIGYVSIHEE